MTPIARLSTAAGLAILALSACATPPSSSENEKAASGFVIPDGATAQTHVQVRMRDGARLDTAVYLPAGTHGGIPAILIRTPYKTELRGSYGALYTRFLEAGYAVIEQHERGRYFSEGNFSMIPRPAEDGWDTLDWIAMQEWSNGRVGTIGCSSSAENQLKLAAARHPAHRVFAALSAGVGVAEAGPFREQGNFWRGGAWQQGWFDYFYSAMQQDWPQLPANLSDEARQRAAASFALSNAGWGVDKAEFDRTRMHLPMVEIMEAMEAPRNELPLYLRRGPVHPSWAENRISEGEPIMIPGFWAEAIYDISARSTVAYFDWNRQGSPAEQRMRITQGGHCSFGRESDAFLIGEMDVGDARWAFADELFGFMDRHLGGEGGKAQDRRPYRAYLADGTWADAEALSYGGGETWALGADGTFGTPVAGDGAFTFRYDPANPRPSLGGEIGGTGTDHKDGAFDQRPLEEREDVLTFTSAPLEAPMDLLGYATVSLTVSSDRPDTDFTVKLMDVFPDGRSYTIGDTILRMRYREGLEEERFMEAGTLYTVDLPPILLSRRIEEGHRLKVHVSSSDFPNYARNLNTVEDPYTSTAMAIATNTVHVGSDARSSVTWPKVPSGFRVVEDWRAAGADGQASSVTGTMVTLSPQPQASVWFGLLNTNRLDKSSVT